MPQIHLDETTHVYRVGPDRVVVPSVTTILADVGLIDTTWFNDQALIRGTFVHEATALDDRDDLDDDSVDAQLACYIEAWRAFRSETGCEILSIEQRVASPAFTYAGTLDRRIRFNGYEWVLDIKTGGSLRWHALQVAAYASLVIPIAAAEPGARFTAPMVKRATVHLRDNGRYSFTPHAAPRDFDIFGAAVALYHWKRTK